MDQLKSQRLQFLSEWSNELAMEIRSAELGLESLRQKKIEVEALSWILSSGWSAPSVDVKLASTTSDVASSGEASWASWVTQKEKKR